MGFWQFWPSDMMVNDNHIHASLRHRGQRCVRGDAAINGNKQRRAFCLQRHKRIGIWPISLAEPVRDMYIAHHAKLTHYH